MPRRSEKRPYRNERLALPACKPLQRPKIGFRKRRNPFVGNSPPGWRSREFEQFWGFYGFGCMNYKTSHRFQGEDIADCLQSQIFDMRVKNELLGWLVAWKSAVHRKPIAITRFAAHLSRPKMPDITTLAFGLYITYRAILNIELYNWQPQKR